MPAPNHGPTPQPLSVRDAAALIGVLSVLEDGSRHGHIDNNLAHSLKTRLQSDGHLAKGTVGQAALRDALSALSDRLRQALGEEVAS